jgi:predicted DNA-binding transcriptional regulator AlpA
MTSPQPATLDREKDKLRCPPWQGIETLARNIDASVSTVESWVSKGVLPPARKRGGKLMWKWSEVDAWLTDGGQNGPPNTATEVRDAVRREREADAYADH